MAKNCSILSQKVPKFTLYKHNDELFNIYPAMTAFTDQYSLPNIFFDIGQL